MAIRTTADGRPRSAAWMYYAVISVLLVIGAFSGLPSALLFAAVTGVYSVYLFRGGRYVLWIW
jgi:hypothetical protein